VGDSVVGCVEGSKLVATDGKIVGATGEAVGCNEGGSDGNDVGLKGETDGYDVGSIGGTAVGPLLGTIVGD